MPDALFVSHFGLLRHRNVPQGVNASAEQLQAIIPSSTSDLATNRELIISPNGIHRVYRDEIPTDGGPMNATDAAAYTLGAQMTADMDTDNTNYQQAFVSMVMNPNQPITSQPIESLQNTGLQEQQGRSIKDIVDPGVSRAAQFLARIRGYKPTGEETIGDQLKAAAKDFLDTAGGLYQVGAGGLIPADTGYHARRDAEKQRKINAEKRGIMQDLADAQGIDLSTPGMQEMMDATYPTEETAPPQADVPVSQSSPAVAALTDWQNNQQTGTDTAVGQGQTYEGSTGFNIDPATSMPIKNPPNNPEEPVQ